MSSAAAAAWGPGIDWPAVWGQMNRGGVDGHLMQSWMAAGGWCGLATCLCKPAESTPSHCRPHRAHATAMPRLPPLTSTPPLPIRAAASSSAMPATSAECPKSLAAFPSQKVPWGRATLAAATRACSPACARSQATGTASAAATSSECALPGGLRGVGVGLAAVVKKGGWRCWDSKRGARQFRPQVPPATVAGTFLCASDSPTPDHPAPDHSS